MLIESDPELECPNGFPDTDSKNFLGTMFGPRVQVLERRLKVDLAPLKYCATDTSEGADEMMREDWGDEADAMIAEARRNSELAWHSPDEFIVCFEQLVKRLEESGRKLSSANCRAISMGDHERGYFQSGSFLNDVSGCLAAVRLLKEKAARRVRFFAF